MEISAKYDFKFVGTIVFSLILQNAQSSCEQNILKYNVIPESDLIIMITALCQKYVFFERQLHHFNIQ